MVLTQGKPSLDPSYPQHLAPLPERGGWCLVMSLPTASVQGERPEPRQGRPPCLSGSLPEDLGLADGAVVAGGKGWIALDYVMASSAKMVCRPVVEWPCTSAIIRRAGGVLR